jgi:hypothetical protein
MATVLVLPASLAYVVAFSVGGVQATEPPTWMLNPYLTEPGPALPVALATKAEGTLALTSKVLGGTTLEISCTTMTSEGTLLEAEGKSSGKLAFSGCVAKLGGVTSKNCEPQIGAEKGVIRTNALKGSIVLNEGTPLYKIEPVTGTTLATSTSTEACAFGEKAPIGGTFYAKDSNGKFEVEELSHKFQEGPLTKLWVLSETAEHKATISGSVGVSLSGEHLNRWWSGLGA